MIKKIILSIILFLCLVNIDIIQTDGGISAIQDIQLISRVLYFECRSEPLIGKIAVGMCVLNRAKNNNLTVQGVISKPNQFNYKGKILDKKSFSECTKIAKDIYEGKYNLDPTEGAQYFHSVKKDKPKWAKAKGFTQTVQINSHKFYKSEE